MANQPSFHGAINLVRMELHFLESHFLYVSEEELAKQECVQDLESRSKAIVITVRRSCSQICRE